MFLGSTRASREDRSFPDVQPDESQYRVRSSSVLQDREFARYVRYCCLLLIGDCMADSAKLTRLSEQVSLTSPGSPQTLPSEAVLDALKLILIGTSLAEVLTSVTRLIEAHSDGMLCSIFLVEKDGLHLRYAAARNLPESYRIATDGAAVGPGGGPCSMAVHSRQAVFVADFLSDPNFVSFRSKPVSAGVLAGLSSPIMSHEGTGLGPFGTCFR